MDNIQLGKPYKVSEHKHDQYVRHYDVPIANCVLVPVKKYGEHISCDLLWKDSSGEAHRRDDLMFNAAYLQPVDAMRDYSLFDLWEEYEKNRAI
jgi:hypothetical protein